MFILLKIYFDLVKLNQFAEILKSYTKKLTNLTSNNKSLLLLKLNKDSFIDFKKLDYSYNHQSCSNLLESIILRKNTIPICSQLDSRDKISNDLSNHLFKIYRKDSFIFEENGSKNLYFGYPIIEGQLLDKTYIRAPLIFFPLELKNEIIKNKPTWLLSIITDEFPFFNPSFLLAYSHFNKIQLDKNLFDFTFEDSFTSIIDFKNKLYEILKLSKIDINFNSDVFLSNFEFFLDFNKQDIAFKTRVGELKLQPQAVIGIFPFSNSSIEQDYENLAKNTSFESIEQYFESKSTLTSVIKEENIVTPFEIDAYQENALCELKSGKSIVVQGPPGTGKSQLICNIISDFLANSKKVLVVCQKRVALDVVYNRLKNKGLSDFIGLIHDYKYDRNLLYSKITQQVENLDLYQTQNGSYDTISLERDFLSISRQIQHICEELDGFKIALFSEIDFGISIKKLYLHTKISQNFNQYFDFYANLNYLKLNLYLNQINQILPYSKIIENDNFPLRHRISFEKLTIIDKNKLLTIIDDIYENSKTLVFIHSYLTQPISFLELVNFKPIVIEINNIEKLLINEEIFNIFSHFFQSNIQIKKLKIELDSILDFITNTSFENTIKSTDLEQILLIINATINSCKGTLSLLYWKMFNKNNSILLPIFKKNNLEFSIQNLIVLQNLVINRINIEQKIQFVIKKLGYNADYRLYNFSNFNNLYLDCSKAIDAYNIHIEFQKYINFRKNSTFNFNEYLTFINDLRINICQAKTIYDTYTFFFTPLNVVEISKSTSSKENFKNCIQFHFENIIAYDTLLSKFSFIEREIFINYTNQCSDLQLISTHIQNNAYNCWIYLIEKKYPILTSCTTLKLSTLETRLQQLLLDKQDLSIKILLLKLKEFTYKDIEYNRLNNIVSYRELVHQTKKKRLIWPVRKLFDSFMDDILKIIPCWLASPETVSAVFPTNECFDVVIFDEASQCFAEKGFASTIRAKQICVVGDDKQLAPNDLYQPRYDEVDEMFSDTEIDSLLLLSEKYLGKFMLKMHYRSLNFDLIRFSNQYFYEKKLQFIPNYSNFFKNSLSIEYLKLDGIWHKNTNLIEANYIVNLVFSLHQDFASKSLGVVTFNAAQQTLIEELLFQKYALASLNFPSNIFIKNIENVQGDESDIIVFSIGYAPDYSGKLSMQFGTLNLQNGENRLNVALTRAKEKIYLVTSIFPNQLQVEHSLNQGPKLLKLYLEYAYNLSNNIKNHNNNFINESYDNLSSKLTEKNSNILKFTDSFADAIKNDCLILTDDNQFYHSISSKDFFGYKPLSLKSKNWTFERIFSRQFWLDSN